MRKALKIVLGILLAVIAIGAITFCVSESLVIRASKGQNYEDADYIIVLGPVGGERGGRIVAKGTPEEVAKVKGSYTGQYLKKML